MDRIQSHPHFPVPTGKPPITFWFQGKSVNGRQGDTIGSALYGAGVKIFSRSFKYHRPRGFYDGEGLGSEVLVTVDGEPNVLADRILIQPGMKVTTQNAWPSVHWDLLSINNWAIPLLPNGFYYKMFHKPKWAWPLFEKGIRKAAGLGRIDSGSKTETRYDKRYRFPDVLVVGGGVAGMAAAMAATKAGKEVLLVDENANLGGRSRYGIMTVRGPKEFAGKPQHEAAAKLVRNVTALSGIEVLTSANAFGVYEDNLVAVMQGSQLFKVRAESIVFATGASDRHLVFENNDIPGIITGSASAQLICAHGIRPGKNAVVVTSHDGGFEQALLLHGAGCRVAAVADGRPSASGGFFEQKIKELGIPIHYGETIHAARGRRKLDWVTLGDLSGRVPTRAVDCDILVVSVGFKPQLTLLSMGRKRPQWDAKRQVLRVTDLPDGMYAAGEVHGHGTFSEIFAEGWEVGEAAATQAQCPSSKDREGIFCLPP